MDYVSYSCNLIASNKAKEIENNIYSKYSFLNGILFKELKESIENLFLDVGNANDDLGEHIISIYRFRRCNQIELSENSLSS